MKKVILLLTIIFGLSGCIKKKIFIKSEERRGVVYTQPPIVYEEPIQSYEHQQQVVYTQEPVVVSNEGRSYSVEPGEAYDMILSDPFITILDVRMPQEIKQDGKIANSLLIPLPYLKSNLSRLDKSKKILVYCHTGNRSREAVRFLAQHGYEAINLNGGIEKWKREHLTVKY